MPRRRSCSRRSCSISKITSTWPRQPWLRIWFAISSRRRNRRSRRSYLIRRWKLDNRCKRRWRARSKSASTTSPPYNKWSSKSWSSSRDSRTPKWCSSRPSSNSRTCCRLRQEHLRVRINQVHLAPRREWEMVDELLLAVISAPFSMQLLDNEIGLAGRAPLAWCTLASGGGQLIRNDWVTTGVQSARAFPSTGVGQTSTSVISWKIGRSFIFNTNPVTTDSQI